MTENEKLQHSKAGIASFVLGGIIFVYIGSYIGRFIGANLGTPIGTPSPIFIIDPIWVILESFGLIGKTIIGNIFGVILGVVGMRQRDKKRVFAKLGFWINLILIILFAISILNVLIHQT
jgi:hypothetical protein